MSKRKKAAILSTLIAISLSGTAMAAELTVDYANGQYTATGTGIATDITTDGSNLYDSLKAVGWSDVYLSPAVAITNANSYYDSTSNQITINGGTDYTQIIGDKSIEGDSSNNTVTINDTFVSSKIYTATTTKANTNGNANNNVLNISNTTVDGTAAAGGYSGITAAMVSADGSASGNIINISDDSVIRQAVWGASVGTGDAVSNKVTVDNSTVEGWISAGHSAFGNAHQNTLIISGDNTQTGQIHGGRAQSNGSANENSVTITGGTVNGLVWGGAAVDTIVAETTATDVEASRNTVTITGGTVNAYVAAGYSKIGKTNDNIVNITGGTVNDKVYGGYSVKGDANDNIVNITGGTINKNVYSGYGATEASGNTVNITGGTIDANANVYGGLTAKGDANNNNVGITNTKIGKQIVGGWSNDGAANYNTVKLDKAYGSVSVFTGVSTNADAVGNKLEIILGDNDLDLKGPKALDSYGGNSLNGDAVENVIEISAEGNGKLTGRFYGGVSDGAGADAIRNKIVVNSGTLDIQTMHAGYTVVNSGDAIANEMIINGGTITAENICGGKSYSSNANENIVNITGGTVDGNIYGGHGKLEANDNVVNIGGTAALANASLYGSNHADGTGNVLNVNDGWSGDVKSVQNFNEINISEATWGETAVTVTDTLALNDTKVTVGAVHVAGDDTTFAPNGSSTVIAADGAITGDVSADSSVEVFKGVATIYDASIVKDGNDINIQLAGEETGQFNPQMNPQVLVIGESRTAATAFVNQGVELIETGINALALDEVTADETKVFAALYNGASKYETGSNVKVNGWSGIVGIGKTTDNGLTYGAFFESGEGNYRTYNNMDGVLMRGDGEANYNGGGLLVRKDNANGIYTEASLRAGNLSNRLDGAVMGSEGLTGYDIDTTYYGAHVGIGKVIPKGADSLDVYGKFLYTHHDSDTFEINGDEFHFDSMDSQRLRLGFRYNKAQTAKVGLYYGAAYEYEFGGDADNTVVGYDLSTPSLEGSTVIGELGMHYIASTRWSLDANLRGYTGQRDGWSGSVQANYKF